MLKTWGPIAAAAVAATAIIVNGTGEAHRAEQVEIEAVRSTYPSKDIATLRAICREKSAAAAAAKREHFSSPPSVVGGGGSANNTAVGNVADPMPSNVSASDQGGDGGCDRVEDFLALARWVTGRGPNECRSSSSLSAAERAKCETASRVRRESMQAFARLQRAVTMQPGLTTRRPAFPGPAEDVEFLTLVWTLEKVAGHYGDWQATDGAAGSGAGSASGRREPWDQPSHEHAELWGFVMQRRTADEQRRIRIVQNKVREAMLRRPTSVSAMTSGGI